MSVVEQILSSRARKEKKIECDEGPMIPLKGTLLVV